MSRLTDATTTSHRLTLTAMEEASRLDRHDADLEHLFLALVLDSHEAGQLLRREGVSLERARAAVTGQHQDQLDLLGINVDPAPAGEISFDRTGGYRWTQRASDVLGAASAKGARGDSIAVLRALLAEPSGVVADLLTRLDLSRVELDAELDAMDALSRHDAPRAGALTRSGTVFVPAPPSEIWNLVSDPARLPEWDLVLGSVRPATREADAADTYTWEGMAAETTPAGKPMRIAAAYRRQLITVRDIEAPSHIAWHMTYPDAARANARLVTLRLEPSAEGTLVHITLTWELSPRPGIRRFIGRILRPLSRFALWMQVSQLSANISRTFR